MNPTTIPRNGVVTGFPEYHGRNRFPKEQPKGFCRGCRLPIDPELEPRAQTWHYACKKKFDPFFVKRAVRIRDNERCVFCGKDCSREARRNYKAEIPRPPEYARDCGLPFPCDYKAYYSHPLYKQFEVARKAWNRNQPKPEYDHIIPHSEGGLFTVENIRLLCASCHKQRTAEWRRSKSKASQREARQCVMT